MMDYMSGKIIADKLRKPMSYKDLTDKPDIPDISSGDIASAQPNFQEATETVAALGADIKGTPVLGAGWSGTGPYTLATGSYSCISFPVNIATERFYEIDVQLELTAGSVEFCFSANPDTFIGQNFRYLGANSASTTYVVEANNNYSYLIIRKTSNAAGKVNSVTVKEFITLNSESLSVKGVSLIMKKNANGGSCFYGGGGKTMIAGSDNTGFGRNALKSVKSGDSNSGFGKDALIKTTTGRANCAFGVGTLEENTSGFGNVAMGYAALCGNVAGSLNVVIGMYAFTDSAGGKSNTIVGAEAFKFCAGDENVALGHNAGNVNNISNASKSVFIGAETSGVNNQTNQIAIGYGAKGCGSNTAHIGNTDITSISFGAGTGTSFTNRSDRRLKNITEEGEIDFSICYKNIKDIPLHRFEYKPFVNSKDKHMLGFIADEFKQYFPQAVFEADASFDERDENGNIIYETVLVDDVVLEDIEITDPETGETRTELCRVVKPVEKQVPRQVIIKDCASIDTSQIIPAMLGAMKFLMSEVESMKAEIADLKAAKEAQTA